MLTSPKDPETALRRLSEAGVLARFIPAFGRVVAQMQYDMYHTYTVDEHTIRAIGILDRIEKGELQDSAPVTTEVVAKIVSRRDLYPARSEEPTSELPSLMRISSAVCSLKKQQNYT